MTKTFHEMAKAYRDLCEHNAIAAERGWGGDSGFESDFGALGEYIALLQDSLRKACAAPVVMVLSANDPVRLVALHSVHNAARAALGVTEL